MKKEHTRDKLVQLAAQLIKEKGYSSFSYADLAAEIGISKASIHHHFPNKADLGAAVAQENCVAFQAALNHIAEQYASFTARLTAYFMLFADTPEELPMCAALAADKNNLPDILKSQAQQHFELQLNWLTQIVQTAYDRQELSPAAPAAELAVLILNTIEGASLTTKALNRKDIFEISLRNLLNLLQAV